MSAGSRGFIGWRRALARCRAGVVLLTTWLVGCIAWTNAPGPPSALVARNEQQVRVHRRDGVRLDLHQPFISGDSLGGTRYADGFLRYGRDRVVVPLRDIASVEVRRVDGARTAGAVLGVGLLAAIAAAAASTASYGPSFGGGGFALGSCPLVYSWDGERWRLDSGTFATAIARALQRADVDNLEYAAPADGVLRLRLANELPETDHVDALTVLAVDHAPGLTVSPDPVGGLHLLGALEAPLAAADYRGDDALARVSETDGWGWESSPTGRDPLLASDLRDGLDLVFVRPAGATRAHLVLDGVSTPWSAWMLQEFVRAHGSATPASYAALDADPALAQATMARLASEALLSVSVRTSRGWESQGSFTAAGHEVMKRQVIDLDLARVAGDTVRVRLESAPLFWNVDRVALDFTADRDFAVRQLDLVSARAAGGRDVRSLLAAADRRELVLETGEAAELRFGVPQLPAGRTRTFLVRSTGWYQLHLPATGQPDVAALASLAADPFGVARASLARMNAALETLSERGR